MNPTLRFLLPLFPLVAAATCCASGYKEDFGDAPFPPDETVVGVNGWILRSASPQFGTEAAVIRSGGPAGAPQSLEVVTTGEEATFVRKIITPPVEVSASRNNRFSVDLLYENPQDFRSGVIYLAVATNSGGMNLGLSSGAPGETGIAFVDLGSNERRFTSPPNTFKAGTWYRFTVDLYQGAAGRSARISLSLVTASGDTKPVWEEVADMDGFNPTAVERFDLSVARTGRISALRVGRFGAISVTTMPGESAAP